jgi:pimeloyl-ACP methyl ester carboxylesterase
MPALAETRCLAVAPNQRGYSADARPDPGDFESYRVDRLTGDAVDIVAAAGHGERRFHLVGHDWGGCPAWLIADRYPERLASLTMLSLPHPASSPGRWRCPTASKPIDCATIGNFSTRGRDRGCSPITPPGCAPDWRATGAGSGDRRTFIGDR